MPEEQPPILFTRRAFLRAAGLCALSLALPNLPSKASSEPFRVPPTLMLHMQDRWKLPHILAWLRERNYESIGYADLLKALQGARHLPEKPIILTIDDIAPSYVHPHFMAMAEEVEKAGYRGVFAVVTNQPPHRAAEGWAQLRALAERGWEMETHTIRHSYLPGLKLPELREEIIRSAEWIAEGIGRAPLCLIAPYGGVRRRGREFDMRIFEVAAEAKLAFVVGIAGGRFIAADAKMPYYVGRVGSGRGHLQAGFWIKNFYRS